MMLSKLITYGTLLLESTDKFSKVAEPVGLEILLQPLQLLFTLVVLLQLLANIAV
jgi:hypothetical protein